MRWVACLDHGLLGLAFVVGKKEAPKDLGNFLGYIHSSATESWSKEMLRVGSGETWVRCALTP